MLRVAKKQPLQTFVALRGTKGNWLFIKKERQFGGEGCQILGNHLPYLPFMVFTLVQHTYVGNKCCFLFSQEKAMIDATLVAFTRAMDSRVPLKSPAKICMCTSSYDDGRCAAPAVSIRI